MKFICFFLSAIILPLVVCGSKSLQANTDGYTTTTEHREVELSIRPGEQNKDEDLQPYAVFFPKKVCMEWENDEAIEREADNKKQSVCWSAPDEIPATGNEDNNQTIFRQQQALASLFFGSFFLFVF